MHHCQPGDPAECSWGCFTPRQYCSQERGAIHSISLLIILFHICHKHCTGVIENLQNKKMMIPSRLHLMVSTVRETELLELKHWWHHQPSPTSMSSSRWALQNLGGVENSDGKWWRQYGSCQGRKGLQGWHGSTVSWDRAGGKKVARILNIADFVTTNMSCFCEIECMCVNLSSWCIFYL